MANPNPTHLFINYATEDVALARWLAQKLAARGHAVWFDKLKPLGGEPWPHTPREAIKLRSFRVLSLISESSLRKKRPSTERTLAAHTGRQLEISDFIIPLSVDGNAPDKSVPSRSNISFENSWIGGWKALVKKLDSIQAPRALKNGTQLAVASFPHGKDLIKRSGEKLFTNIIRVKTFPATLRVFQAAESVDAEDREALELAWTFYEISKEAIVALIPPPPEFSDCIRPTHEHLLWVESGSFHNLRVRDIAASLILKALARRVIQAGCLKHPNAKLQGTFYLPENFAEDGQLVFTGMEGKKVHLPIREKVAFRRAAGVMEINFHHFAFRLRLARGLDQSFYVQLIPTLVFFNEQGDPITDDKATLSRLRRVTRTWDNEEWLKRTTAIEHVLSNSSPAGVNDPVLEKAVLALNSPTGLDEMILYPEKISKKTPELELELEEPETEEADE
jgi:hypothetical protein